MEVSLIFLTACSKIDFNRDGNVKLLGWIFVLWDFVGPKND